MCLAKLVPSDARAGAAGLSIEDIHAAIVCVAAGAEESPFWGSRGRTSRADDVRVLTTVANNFPAAGILAAAHENGADIIVMATHGRTGLGRAILGSVALDVVREGNWPVLLVRPTADVAARPIEAMTAP
jgi:nucleotide-binding universal stress UspA family protein